MASFILTPNMQLPVPTIGQEPGPQYAQDINNSLTILDGHDHSPGNGAAISPSGLIMSSDLSMLGNNVTNVRTVRFLPQSAAPAGPSDLGCLYEVGSDLYFKDGIGNDVRITQSGAVAGSPGSISNLTSPASASYSSAAKTFTFQSAALTPANLDGASVVLRNLVPSSFGLTLSPPTLTNDVSITLPAIPASTLPVSISNTGAMSAQQITMAQLIQSIQDALVPAGTIIASGSNAVPSGYLFCNGQAVSRTTYSNLFAAIGAAYGFGDGSTTFNVPDAQGLFLRGVSNGSTRDPDAGSRVALNPGGSVGNVVGSYQTSTFESHSHSFVGSSGAPTGGTFAAVSLTPIGSASITTLAGGSTETRPINIYVNYFIKT